jgi:hypothetical protein
MSGADGACKHVLWILLGDFRMLWVLVLDVSVWVLDGRPAMQL